MEKMRTVVLYGPSLSVAAIGAGLAGKSGWQVISVDSASPAATRRLCRLRPDVVLFDLAAAQPEAAILLLKELPALLLIGVDLANHQALVLSGEQPRLFTADDFVKLIDAQPIGGPTAAGNMADTVSRAFMSE
jgi:hypothetical protein